MTNLAVNLLEITAPTLEYGLLAPVLVLFAAACLGVLVEAAVPPARRYWTQLVLFTLAIVGSGAFLVMNLLAGRVGILAMKSITLDGPTYLMWASLLVFGFLATMVMAERRLYGGVSGFAASAASVPGSAAEAEANAARIEHTEIYPLVLFALTGMMIFPAANDLITMFVALEVFSLPLYLMSGMARRRRLLSQEAALKYFLLGALASAIFLFGAALLYGYSGGFDLKTLDVAVSLPLNGRGLLYAGLGLVSVGLLFKAGVVPFHSWTPDVYVGAPTSVTGFMAICTKLAAVGGVLRVMFVGLGGERWTWQPIFAVLAVLTMVVGSVIAVTQTDVKRMLAYSSIAHAGFLLTAVVGATFFVDMGQLNSVSAILFYLIAYGFTTIGAFAVVTLVRRSGGEANSISDWSGLGRRNPLLGGIFTLFLLSFAGIPLTGGFIGKWAVFMAAWRGGYAWLVVVAVVMSLVAAFFYLRLIMVMFFGEPAKVDIGRPSLFTWVPIAVGAVATLYLGLMPGQLLDIASLTGILLR